MVGDALIEQIVKLQNRRAQAMGLNFLIFFSEIPSAWPFQRRKCKKIGNYAITWGVEKELFEF